MIFSYFTQIIYYFENNKNKLLYIFKLNNT